MIIRVTVIGERIFDFVRYNRENDFRASGSGQLVYNHDLIPENALRIAKQISEENHFQSMAYDFLLRRTGNWCYLKSAMATLIKLL
jgi:hypothetical protein